MPSCTAFDFAKLDLADRAGDGGACSREHRFPYVVHLAAQAGVRHSLVDPYAYIDANLVGFTNILEGCRHHGCRHLLYASSSSVYGANTRMPFSVHDNVDHPLSLYGASKKANELMAHAYAHLYRLADDRLALLHRLRAVGAAGHGDVDFCRRDHRGPADQAVQ